jgi:transcriptional regulator with XRE-family HTH domain
MVNSGEKKMYAMRSKLPEIVLNKERSLGRKIQINEIAEEAGVTRQTISSWMSHQPFSQINADTLAKILKWADCTLDELLETVEIS